MRGWHDALGLPPTIDDEAARHRIGLIIFYALLGFGVVALWWGIAHAA
jgi:hypothetical protein